MQQRPVMGAPALLDPAALAGDWTLAAVSGDASCAIVLTQQAAADHLAARGDDACLSRLGVGPLVAWYAAPDGLGLLGPNGQIGFFSRTDDGFIQAGPSGPKLVLTKG